MVSEQKQIRWKHQPLVFIENRETLTCCVVPSHIHSSAAPSFYLQTLTHPHSLAPKTLFWSNMTRISCTLFQQQTLLITCNMPGQQTMGTVSYCWVKTVQLRSSGSFMRGALPVRNTVWNQSIAQKCARFRQAETESWQLSCPPSPLAALCAGGPRAQDVGAWPAPYQPNSHTSAGFWQGHLTSCPRAMVP